MHRITQLIRGVNKSHNGLGALIAMNLIAAKSKRCLLNVAPAGCGKSTATDTVGMLLKDRAKKYTSLTMAGLLRLKDELTEYTGHVIIDDLGAEKSEWTRTATIATLAHLVHTHNIYRITQTSIIQINDFNGSAALNIQPVMMQSLVRDDDWVAVVRDKVIRQYHLLRPAKPHKGLPNVTFDWGTPLEHVDEPKRTGALWYQLIAIALSQWSYGRCLEHLPMMLRATAALDRRDKCNSEDYRLLAKLMKPMQLERYIIESYGFEEGRTFNNNVYCLLVELATWGNPTLETIAEDYKVHPKTVERLAATAPEWCAIQPDSPKRLIPTEQTQNIFKAIGVNEKW